MATKTTTNGRSYVHSTGSRFLFWDEEGRCAVKTLENSGADPVTEFVRVPCMDVPTGVRAVAPVNPSNPNNLAIWGVDGRTWRIIVQGGNEPSHENPLGFLPIRPAPQYACDMERAEQARHALTAERKLTALREDIMQAELAERQKAAAEAAVAAAIEAGRRATERLSATRAEVESFAANAGQLAPSMPTVTDAEVAQRARDEASVKRRSL